MFDAGRKAGQIPTLTFTIRFDLDAKMAKFILVEANKRRVLGGDCEF